MEILNFVEERKMEQQLGADLMAWGLVMINTGKPVAAPLEKFATGFLRDIYDKIQGGYPETLLPVRPKSGTENSADLGMYAI